MDTTRHDKVFKTSSPRTGRELDAMAGGGAGVVVGGSSGSGGGGVRYHSELLGVVNSSNYLDTETAIHLTAEKLAEINSFYDKFLRKDTPDTAAEPITFKKGITVTGGAATDTLYVEKGATAGSLYVEETSSTRDLVVRRLAEILQLNVTEVATLARAIVKEFVSSETFIPGFAGEGFKIWQIAAGEWHGEIDSLTIRRSLNAFELLIQKYRAINGGLVISQGSGKIKSVTETDTHYLLEMEGNLTLMPDDFIRCQTWGTAQKYYWVKVEDIEGKSVKVLKSEFVQEGEIKNNFTDASWVFVEQGSLAITHTDKSVHISRADYDELLCFAKNINPGETFEIRFKVTGVSKPTDTDKGRFLSAIYVENGTNNESFYKHNDIYTFRYTNNTSEVVPWAIAYRGETGECDITFELQPESGNEYEFDFNDKSFYIATEATAGAVIENTYHSIHISHMEYDLTPVFTYAPENKDIKITLKITGVSADSSLYTVTGNETKEEVLITSDGVYTFEYTLSEGENVWGMFYKGGAGDKNILIEQLPKPVDISEKNRPAVGDEVVQMGNATDVTRQALILLSATDGKPCIDLLAGVNSKSFAGKLQMRAGCLDGIQDPDFPTDLQPSGYGLYCSNAFLKGSLVLRNGQSVDAEIEGVRTELTAIPGLVTIEVGKMQIGAANLIPNSGFEEEGFFTGGALGEYVERWGATPTDILPVAGNKFFALYTEGKRELLTGNSQFFKVEPNANYVFSIYLYRSVFVGATSSYIWHYDSASDNYIASTVIPVPETTGKWERIIIPFTTKETETRITFRLGYNSTAAGGAVLLADCVQLEKGTVPTAWREASADILSQTKSLIKAESDQLLFQVTRTTTGTRNYVLSSRMNRTSNHWATGGTVNLVTDEKFGTVVEYSRPDGGGEYQFVWELSSTKELNNTDVVFSVIAKRMSESGDWNFGGWNTTFDLCRTTDSNQIDLGGGWINYWTTRKIDYIRGTGNTGTFGINSVSGTWRFYAVGVYKGNRPTDWTTAPEDLESRVSQAELNLQPDNIWLGISNKMSTAVLPRTKQTVDATGLDQSTYYPVTIRLSETEPYTITVHRSLWADYGVPSWSTHPGGFSVVCRWTTNGAGWGTIAIMRTVHEFRYSFSNVLPVGSINQLTNGSREIIWVRGGAKYDVTVEGTPTADIMLHSTTFTEHGQSASPTTSIVEPEPNWDALTRTGINIDTKEITINAETTKIVSNGQVAALFTTDANGKPVLKADFIDTRHIDAETGDVGPFRISPQYLTGKELMLGSSSIAFSNSTTSAIIGTTAISGSTGATSPVFIENKRNDFTNYGMIIDVSGGYEYNHAIWLRGGGIAGFAVAARRIKSTTTLSMADCYITAANTSPVTIYMPRLNNDTEKINRIGKTFRIKLVYNVSTTLDANGQAFELRNYSRPASIGFPDSGYIADIIWDGVYWQLSFIAYGGK